MGSKLKFHCSYSDNSTSFAHGLYNSSLNLHIVRLHITYFIALGSLLPLVSWPDLASSIKNCKISQLILIVTTVFLPHSHFNEPFLLYLSTNGYCFL